MDTLPFLLLPVPQLEFRRVRLDSLSWPPAAPWMQDHTYMVRVLQRYDDRHWGVKEISMYGGQGLGWLGLLPVDIEDDLTTAVVSNHRVFIGPEEDKRSQAELLLGAPAPIWAPLSGVDPQHLPVPTPVHKLLQWHGDEDEMQLLVGPPSDPWAVIPDSPALWAMCEWVVANEHHAIWPIFQLDAGGYPQVQLVPYRSYSPQLGGPR